MEDELLKRFADFMPGGEKQDCRPQFRHVDFSVFGALPLEVCLHDGSLQALKLGLGYAEDQWSPPRGDDTAHFPEWLKSHYVPTGEQNALLEQGYSGQSRFWIDDMYMITFLQTQAYRVTRDRKYLDRAAHEMCLYLERLQLKNGLFDHAKGVPFRWARGNGWMAAAMPLLLRYLPEDHKARPTILSAYRKMMKTLLSFQHADGYWGQLVDDVGSWPESSGTAMFAFAFIAGAHRGWLDDASAYRQAAERAFRAVAQRMDECGNVRDICIGTGAQNSRDYYLNRARLTGDPHGQAAMLWCVNALLTTDAFD